MSVRHYIKILDWMESYARSVAALPADWARSLFDDLTEHGQTITVVPLPGNEHGPLIGLCGETFFCVGGIDRDRQDSLFISRVESAARRLPSSVPRRVTGEFRLLSAGHAHGGPLDPVYPLFGVSGPLQQADVIAADRPERPRARPSAAFRRELCQASDVLRAAWRPAAGLRSAGEDNQARLEAILDVWNRYRIGRFVRLPPRESMILNRQLRPRVNDSDELRPLLDAFEMETLNAIAAAEPSTIAPLLTDLAALPLAAHLHASIWGGLLACLDAVELRRELHAAAASLIALGAEVETAAIWNSFVLEALDSVAARESDTVLADRVIAVRDSSEPLRSLGLWAMELQFQSKNETASAQPEATDQDPPPTEITESSAPAPSHIIDAWVLRLATPGPTFVADLGAEIASRLQTSVAVARDARSLETLVRLLADLQDLSEAAPEWARRLPTARMLLDLRVEAEAAFAKAKAQLGEAAERLIEQAPTPAELTEIIDLVERRAVLTNAPTWLRPPALQTPLDTALWLSNAECRNRFAVLLGVVEDVDLRDLAVLADVPPPPDDADLEAHLCAVLRGILEVEHALRELPEDHETWIAARLAAGDTKADLLLAARELEAIRPRVRPDTFIALVKYAGTQASAGERIDLINAYEAAIRFFEQNLGSASDATIGQLESRVARQGASASAEPPLTTTIRELTIEHALMGAEAARSPISFHALGDLPYGRIAVPIVIEAGRPADYALRLSIDVKGKWRQAWPSTWPEPSPGDLQIRRDAWRQTDLHRWTFTQTLDIPTRPSGRGAEPLEVEISLRDAIREAPLSDPKRLRWDHVESEVTTLALDWPEGVMPGYVESHPIGAQKKIDQIVRRVQSGNSFAVVAPRRFGKSTLIEYLAARLCNESCVVPQPIVCTQFFDSTGIDHLHLWREVSDRLQKELGSALDLSLEGGIPVASAFDYVRQAAQKKRKRAIVLLFDESQLFFGGAEGTAVGDRLKDRIERSWAQDGDGARVPVLFGFVGLLSLTERAGANLVGLLRPIENREMDEADLNRLLLSVTHDRLATTREARLKLIRTAGNLFLLRILVESLVDRLTNEGRRWATWNDVLAVEADLMRELREGSAQHVGHWLRDALNEADSINDWRPSREYPLALALAEVRRQGAHRTEDVKRRARNVLNTWCAEVDDGSQAKLSFTAQRIDEHLLRMREQRIIVETEFRSPLLEAWLLGQARTGYPSNARNALVKGAHVTIRTPDGAEVIDAGGQATVLRFTENGIEKAMRRAALHDDRDRQRFLETAASLEVLAQGEHLGKPGSQYIFHLEAVGFADDDEMTAVQIYRWIDGSHLGEQLGALDAPLVADIGYRLALAVSLLHGRHIIHRDIRPRNVILARQDKRPVLIDFGMSRFETSAMATAVPSEFSPPEVQTSKPHWTRSADIFGLGRTLESLLAEPSQAPADLRKVLAACVDEDPQRRPDASGVTERLREIRDRLLVEEKRRDFWSSVLQTATPDHECAWFMDVLRKFQPGFEALHLGIHRDAFERAAEIADFLNQLLEAFPPHSGSQRLSLGYVKRANDVTGDQLVDPSIDFLHNARTWLSHGSGKGQRRDRILASIREPRDVAIQALVEGGASKIATFLGVRSLSAIVEQLTNQ